MATTLPLVRSLKIDTRRDGAVSFAKVEVIADGHPVTYNFYSRVGEEAIVIDEAAGTITVSDEYAASAARMGAEQRATAARLAGEREAMIAKAIALVDVALDKKNAPAAARAEVHALCRKYPHEAATGQGSGMVDYRLAIGRILARYKLA